MLRRQGWLVFLVVWLMVPSQVFACRFWCAIGKTVEGRWLIEHLIDAEHSMRNLGEKYDDGWSVGYVRGGLPKILRGHHSAFLDPAFERAVYTAGQMYSSIVISHLRLASSGCVDGVPNPHPFIRKVQGKTWMFGHNGGMSKKLLTDLMGKEYLNRNRPQVCTYDAPDSWIDSELYFIYLMQQIEKQGHVEQGLIAALNSLYERLPEEMRYLNFFLSDGEHIWVFRKGTSLYYMEDAGITFVASTAPDESGAWQEFPEDTLARLSKTERIVFVHTIKSPEESN